MDHAVHSGQRRWQRSGGDTDEIGSIMIAQLDWLDDSVRQLFQRDHVPDAGIVISSDDRVADGGRIEKNCYERGGFVFLVRPSGGEVDDRAFPTGRLTALLERIGAMYVRDVVGLEDGHVTLASCWAVCQRDGDYGTLHNHVPPEGPGGDRYSGMLYLQIPATINPGTFPNGCLHIVTSEGGVVYIPPIPGSITFWPSELLHGIHPFRGSGDRLGIAFDMIWRKER